MWSLSQKKKVYKKKKVMLTSVFRALVNDLVKESFYGEKKNVLTVFFFFFFIFHKSAVKTFLK